MAPLPLASPCYSTLPTLGSEFPDSTLVQKIVVTVPERFEATISSFENSKTMLVLVW